MLYSCLCYIAYMLYSLLCYIACMLYSTRQGVICIRCYIASYMATTKVPDVYGSGFDLLRMQNIPRRNTAYSDYQRAYSFKCLSDGIDPMQS